MTYAAAPLQTSSFNQIVSHEISARAYNVESHRFKRSLLRPKSSVTMQHLLRPLELQLPSALWCQPAPSLHYYMPPPPPTHTARQYLQQQSCVPSHLQLWQPPQAAFTFSLPHDAAPRYPGPVPDRLSVPELERKPHPPHISPSATDLPAFSFIHTFGTRLSHVHISTTDPKSSSRACRLQRPAAGTKAPAVPPARVFE